MKLDMIHFTISGKNFVWYSPEKKKMFYLRLIYRVVMRKNYPSFPETNCSREPQRIYKKLPRNIFIVKI